MDRIEEARLAWQRAQADLQKALATLERRVAEGADVTAITKARAEITLMQATADEYLNRYITYVGKAD